MKTLWRRFLLRIKTWVSTGKRTSEKEDMVKSLNFLIVFLIVLSLVLSSLVVAQEEKLKLKEGPGKKLVEANCTICHSLDYILINSPFLDKKGWEASVNKMIQVMGAPINKEDVPQIIEYLTTYYGKKESSP
jgi:hypothetical protein